jgi:serine protease inhibitor
VHFEINVDRPFGFLAVEPDTGLLLFAGWVTEKECSWAPL